MADLLLFRNMFIEGIQNVLLYEICATYRNKQHTNKCQAAGTISEIVNHHG